MTAILSLISDNVLHCISNIKCLRLLALIYIVWLSILMRCVMFLFLCMPLEVLAINESSSVTDGEIYICWYGIIRKDHTRHGRGVALYIREGLSSSNRVDLVPDSLEMICVEMNLPYNRSFLVSTWYRPPGCGRVAKSFKPSSG